MKTWEIWKIDGMVCQVVAPDQKAALIIARKKGYRFENREVRVLRNQRAGLDQNRKQRK